jgi:hypothetical protein
MAQRPPFGIARHSRLLERSDDLFTCEVGRDDESSNTHNRIGPVKAAEQEFADGADRGA